MNFQDFSGLFFSHVIVFPYCSVQHSSGLYQWLNVFETYWNCTNVFTIAQCFQHFSTNVRACTTVPYSRPTRPWPNMRGWRCPKHWRSPGRPVEASNDVQSIFLKHVSSKIFHSCHSWNNLSIYLLFSPEKTEIVLERQMQRTRRNPSQSFDQYMADMVCLRSWLRRFSNCRAELAQADPNSEAWGILGQPLVWLVFWLVLVWCVQICQDVLGWILLNTFDAPGCKGATGRNGPIRKWPLRRPDRRRVKRQTRSLPKLHVEEFCRAEHHVAKKLDIDWLLLAYLLNNLSIPTCLYSQYETFQGHPTNRPSQPFFRHRTCWMVQ